MSGKGYSIVFSSRTGNTAELAETVREALPEGTCEYFGSVNDAVDGGFGGSEAYFQAILDKTKAFIDDSNTVIGTFMCQGKMPHSVRERYVKMKEQPNHMPNLDAMIENFDKALSHPDADDLEKLANLVRETVGQ